MARCKPDDAPSLGSCAGMGGGERWRWRRRTWASACAVNPPFFLAYHLVGQLVSLSRMHEVNFTGTRLRVRRLVYLM
jgi:hypothetical protein